MRKNLATVFFGALALALIGGSYILLDQLPSRGVSKPRVLELAPFEGETLSEQDAEWMSALFEPTPQDLARSMEAVHKIRAQQGRITKLVPSSQAWQLWDQATNDSERAAVLLRLGKELGSNNDNTAEYTTFLTAAAQLAALEGRADLLSDAAAILADAKSRYKHHPLAAELYARISSDYPDELAWARCTVNAGSLMRQLGRFEEGIALLDPILARKGN